MNASSSRRILVACIGNIFMGDDGFGVEVAQQLFKQRSKYGETIEIVDFGIRGIELAYSLLDAYEVLILVDAVPRGGAPGTLYLLEPDLTTLRVEQTPDASRFMLDSHSLDPMKVLLFAQTLGAHPIRTLIVGCEPTHPSASADYEEMCMGLSASVQAAIPEAITMIDTLLAELTSQKTIQL
ncbi:hydrogenase maturation protease [Tengunoibacter tsumagoiensis]|uniref:Peptidase M52 n=1 Tax=Tengunoibacter tsumagoiensis TaxID=2014871 RepID=A0A402A0V8_9CHLR|nr:hydrogenase maturation protease [Tengunoibacter tsumagoiensis]GCE12790.1 peptidase M52 [Tengunoibacter tsumagoiensis]